LLTWQFSLSVSLPGGVPPLTQEDDRRSIRYDTAGFHSARYRPQGCWAPVVIPQL
jgi:hypothetical protein